MFEETPDDMQCPKCVVYHRNILINLAGFTYWTGKHHTSYYMMIMEEDQSPKRMNVKYVLESGTFLWLLNRL
jgi:hypothetical protein